MSATPWTLDPTRKEYYYFDKSENAYVYQSGRRIYVQHATSRPDEAPLTGSASTPSASFNPSSAPPPPPKAAGQISTGFNTPPTGPPRPPPPPSSVGGRERIDVQGNSSQNQAATAIAQVPPPEGDWLPEILKDKR
jgi:hypothetical protein